MVTISYFAVHTKQSNDLYNVIKSYCENKGYNISFKDASSISQYEFLVGVHGDTLSVVDASIETENGEYLSTVYPILTAHINIFKHILVVSRTPIPLNICPPTEGGYPNTLYEKEKDNDEIAEWLKDNIDKIVEKEIHTPSLRVKIDSQDALMSLKPQMEQMLHDNLLEDNTDKKVTKVLISYRSKYYDKVIEHIKNYQNKEEEEKEYEFHVVQSRNELSSKRHENIIVHERLCGENEAPTPMQRWRMVGQLEGLIRNMDEIWIYDTPDYGDSWWTQAEIVMTYYDNYSRSCKNKIKFRPMLQDTLPELISKVDISPEHRQRITRYLSNTRLDRMGPESMDNARQLINIADQIDRTPFFLKFLIRRSMKKVLLMSIPDTLSRKERKKMVEEMLKLYMSPKELRKYAADDVFKNDFWRKISFGICPTNASDFNLTKWISSPMDELTSCTKNELEAASQIGTILLKNKDGIIEMSIEKGEPYYLWLATRMGQPTEKDAPGLEKVQTYNLQTI